MIQYLRKNLFVNPKKVCFRGYTDLVIINMYSIEVKCVICILIYAINSTGQDLQALIQKDSTKKHYIKYAKLQKKTSNWKEASLRKPHIKTLFRPPLNLDPVVVNLRD